MILHIDLSTGEIFHTESTKELVGKWIGGKGLAGSFLYTSLPSRWNNPELPLLFMAGPLTGTPAPASGRITVMSVSPLTGAVCDSSVGGSFGWQMKKAGVDGIVIRGRSNSPCGIQIQNAEVQICDSRSMEGLDTAEITLLLSSLGSVACVGPAAFSGVLFSSIMVDGSYTAGRGGLGLVCASKNLTYLTVRGTGSVHVEDPMGLKKAAEDIRRLTSATPVLTGEHSLRNCGTAACYDIINTCRIMPTDNFRKTFFSAGKSMNSHSFGKRYPSRRRGCMGCHILCKRVSEDGRHLPEFETMSHFSALIGNTDIDAVMDANQLCNRMGMDTISAGSTLACFSEITGECLSPGRISTLLLDIALGRGEGKALGQGSRRYAESKGVPQLSMSVKGMELPAYDPRGAYGMALGYATSTRGGCHLRAYPISHEILRKPVATDRFTFHGKARIVKIAEDVNAAIDSLVACKFLFFGCSMEEYAAAFTSVTGIACSAQDLLDAGERIYFRERMMNHICGFTSDQDDLPERFFNEEGSSGAGISIPPLDRTEFLSARSRYYGIRGLSESGEPLKSRVVDLDLGDLL